MRLVFLAVATSLTLGCRSAARRTAEIQKCEVVADASLLPSGAEVAKCLVVQYGWDAADARQAAAPYQARVDSAARAAHMADSIKSARWLDSAMQSFRARLRGIGAPGTTRRRSSKTTPPEGGGSDVATVSPEGVEGPFPEYLQNVVTQVLRRWQRPLESTQLDAEVSFLIHRDGSVSDLQFTKRSGDFAFDLAAQGAVEETGRFKGFGPLPTGWSSDVMSVRFYFPRKR